MKKRFLLLPAIACMIFSSSLCAQSVNLPYALQGNWMKTDGSNEFVIGLYEENVCYQNNNWDINSLNTAAGHYELNLRNKDASAVIDIYSKDSNTIIIHSGGKEEILRKVRTYNYRYRQQQYSFVPNYFVRGRAGVKGFIHLPPSKKTGLKNSYVEISYANQLTGETEYFQESIDKAGRFEISFPVYKPQICTISQAGAQLASFFVQPDKNIFVAINPEIKINEKNPDYSSVMQRVSLMGDDKEFNNDYQHFLAYSTGVGYPEFKFPFETVKGKSVAEKKQLQFQYYTDLYDKALLAIDHVYPSSRTDQRFRNFIREEIKYNCAYSLLSNLQDQYGEKTYNEYRIDSADLALIYKKFFGQQPSTALLHDAFYKLMGYYVEKLNYTITGGSYTTKFSTAKMNDRIKNDYGVLLTGNFAKTYEKINQARDTISGMTEEQILQKYFHGNQQEAYDYRFILRTISNEFFKEARDSARYASNKILFKDQSENFAANLWQLIHANNYDDDLPMPSVYRLDLFKAFNKNDNAARLLDSLNRDEVVGLALAGLNIRFNDKLVRQIDNEKEWQSALQSFRGKVVVIWMFSHYFDKKHASKSLYELEKMQEMYKGKNVVFLKCIQQRERSDKARQLLGYLKLMKNRDALNDIFYVNRVVSANAMMDEDINGNCIIYNESGQAHHPVYYSRPWNSQKFEELSLASELDSVLLGKGRYYENMADVFLTKSPPGRYSSYSSRDADGKVWTLVDTSGSFSMYTTSIPERPNYLTGDSVYRQLVFMDDSVYYEQQMVLHRKPSPNPGNFLFNTDTYRREMVKNNGWYTYDFNRNERTILIHDDKRKLYKQFEVVMINSTTMVLQLKQ